MAKIHLYAARLGICEIVRHGKNKDKSIFVQSDWDAPGVARAFGWDMVEVQKTVENEDGDMVKAGVECEHRHTDGTIDCPDCGLKASDFIQAACLWIEDNDGKSVEDPGYFTK